MIRGIRKIIIFFFFSVAFLGCHSADMFVSCFKSVEAGGESVTFYLGRANPNPTILNNKLLVFLQGSERESVTGRFTWGAKAAELGFDMLFIEKFAYFDSVRYEKTNCRERRLRDIYMAINYVKNEVYKNNLKEIVIYAENEGAELAPEIACEDNLVKRMIIIGNGGLTYEEKLKILFEKEKSQGYRGIFASNGINTMDSLINLLEVIKLNPCNNKYFLGHTYQYWNSYINYDNDKYYAKLNIPVLDIMGEKDSRIPCESVKYLMEKYGDRKNYTFRIIQGVNQDLADSKGKSQYEKVLKEFIYPWIEKTGKN